MRCLKNRVVVALLAVACAFTAVSLGAVHPVPFQTGEIFGKGVRLEGERIDKAWAVGLDGDRLYVGGTGFLSVYDVKDDPLRPKLLGTTDDMATVRQLAVQDGMVYVVARENGLWVVDCRSGVPKTVGHLPSNTNCTGVDVAGNVCFIGGSRSGIDFVDVTDPTRPQLIANRRLEPFESQSVAYRNGILYSGEWCGRGVTAWDCRDMADIRRTCYHPLVSNGDGVWPQGKWLYACTGWSSADKEPDARPHPGQMGLTVFDLADPSQPKEVGRVDFEYCKASGLDIWIPRASGTGKLVFCAQNLGGLYAVDVTDKAHPKVVDRWVKSNGKGETLSLRRAEGHASQLVASVAVGNGVVYVAGPGRLGAWAIQAKGAAPDPIDRGTPPVNAAVRPAPPTVPEGLLRWLPSDRTHTASVTGVAVCGDTCFAACGTAGLYELALSERGMAERATIPLAECMDVSVAGNRLFVAAGREGFVGYEIGQGGRLVEFLRIDTKGARDVYAYGDGAKWICCNRSVYDISDPAQPRDLGPLFHQARWNKFVGPELIAGRWLICNSALKEFRWADLSAATFAPRPVAGFKSRVGGACAFGDKVLVADNGRWTLLDPGAETMPSLRAFPKGAYSGGIPRAAGNVVAMSSGKSLGVWDFSDLGGPKPLATYALTDGSEAATFWRGHVIVPGWSAGVLMSKRRFATGSFI